jgi:hypothetical protein
MVKTYFYICSWLVWHITLITFIGQHQGGDDRSAIWVSVKTIGLQNGCLSTIHGSTGTICFPHVLMFVFCVNSHWRDASSSFFFPLNKVMSIMLVMSMKSRRHSVIPWSFSLWVLFQSCESIIVDAHHWLIHWIKQTSTKHIQCQKQVMFLL